MTKTYAIGVERSGRERKLERTGERTYRPVAGDSLANQIMAVSEIDDAVYRYPLGVSRELIPEEIEKGVLSRPYDVNEAVLRCELIYEFHRKLVGQYELSDDRPYYFTAQDYLETNEASRGMYGWRDLEGHVTWGEVAWLLIFAYGLKKALQWNEIKFPKACVLVNMQGDERLIELNLGVYRGNMLLNAYFEDIRAGRRYAPLPLLCAYKDALAQGLIPETGGESFVLKEITKSEFKDLLDSL